MFAYSVVHMAKCTVSCLKYIIASEYFKTKSIRRINYMYNFNDIPWSEIQAGHSVLCFYQFNILLIALSLIS